MAADPSTSGADTPPVVLFGTGAMACAIGARLAKADPGGITLVDSWRAGREAIAEHGIVVHEPEATWDARVHVASLEEVPRAVDLVLVLAKSPQTAAIAPVVAGALSDSGLALTLQSGLGNREILETAAGSGRVAQGIALMGATLLRPGEVKVVPGVVVLGEEPGTEAALRPMAARLRAAGISVNTTRDVPRLVWRKLVASCAINPIAALAGVANGALLEDLGHHARLISAANEVGRVAAARGIELDADAGALAVQVARATAPNRCSMLQDLERGAVTEIDALNGAIVAEGRRLGVPVPENESLWRRVREREGRPVPVEAGHSAPAVEA